MVTHDVTASGGLSGDATLVPCPLSMECDATQLGECTGLLATVGGRMRLRGENGCRRVGCLCAFLSGRVPEW